MTRSPRTVAPEMLAAEALERFQLPSGKMLGDMPVVDTESRPVGMLMLKDIVRAGIVQ
jgi:arabinose-5-phosphate isomerase